MPKQEGKPQSPLFILRESDKVEFEKIASADEADFFQSDDVVGDIRATFNRDYAQAYSATTYFQSLTGEANHKLDFDNTKHAHLLAMSLFAREKTWPTDISMEDKRTMLRLYDLQVAFSRPTDEALSWLTPTSEFGEAAAGIASTIPVVGQFKNSVPIYRSVDGSSALGKITPEQLAYVLEGDSTIENMDFYTQLHYLDDEAREHLMSQCVKELGQSQQDQSAVMAVQNEHMTTLLSGFGLKLEDIDAKTQQALGHVSAHLHQIDISAKEAQYQQQLATNFSAVNSAFGFASQLGAAIGSKSLEKIGQIGQIGTQLVCSVSQLTGAFGMAQVTGLAALGPISAIGMAGLALGSLFGSSGGGMKKAIKAIMQALRQLSEQLEQFRQEIHERLDHLDQAVRENYDAIRITYAELLSLSTTITTQYALMATWIEQANSLRDYQFDTLKSHLERIGEQTDRRNQQVRKLIDFCDLRTRGPAPSNFDNSFLKVLNKLDGPEGARSLEMSGGHLGLEDAFSQRLQVQVPPEFFLGFLDKLRQQVAEEPTEHKLLLPEHVEGYLKQFVNPGRVMLSQPHAWHMGHFFDLPRTSGVELISLPKTIVADQRHVGQLVLYPIFAFSVWRLLVLDMPVQVTQKKSTVSLHYFGPDDGVYQSQMCPLLTACKCKLQTHFDNALPAEKSAYAMVGLMQSLVENPDMSRLASSDFTLVPFVLETIPNLNTDRAAVKIGNPIAETLLSVTLLRLIRQNHNSRSDVLTADQVAQLSRSFLAFERTRAAQLQLRDSRIFDHLLDQLHTATEQLLDVVKSEEQAFNIEISAQLNETTRRSLLAQPESFGAAARFKSQTPGFDASTQGLPDHRIRYRNNLIEHIRGYSETLAHKTDGQTLNHAFSYSSGLAFRLGALDRPSFIMPDEGDTFPVLPIFDGADQYIPDAVRQAQALGLGHIRFNYKCTSRNPNGPQMINLLTFQLSASFVTSGQAIVFLNAAVDFQNFLGRHEEPICNWLFWFSPIEALPTATYNISIFNVLAECLPAIDNGCLRQTFSERANFTTPDGCIATINKLIEQKQVDLKQQFHQRLIRSAQAQSPLTKALEKIEVHYRLLQISLQLALPDHMDLLQRIFHSLAQHTVLSIENFTALLQQEHTSLQTLRLHTLSKEDIAAMKVQFKEIFTKMNSTVAFPMTDFGIQIQHSLLRTYAPFCSSSMPGNQQSLNDKDDASVVLSKLATLLATGTLTPSDQQKAAIVLQAIATKQSTTHLLADVEHLVQDDSPTESIIAPDAPPVAELIQYAQQQAEPDRQQHAFQATERSLQELLVLSRSSASLRQQIGKLLARIGLELPSLLSTKANRGDGRPAQPQKIFKFFSTPVTVQKVLQGLTKTPYSVTGKKFVAVYFPDSQTTSTVQAQLLVDHNISDKIHPDQVRKLEPEPEDLMGTGKDEQDDVLILTASEYCQVMGQAAHDQLFTSIADDSAKAEATMGASAGQ